MNILGKEYIVWDKAAKIHFLKPGRSRLTAEFTLSPDIIESVRGHTEKGDKYVFDLPVDINDEQGEIIAHVTKTMYVRKKRIPSTWQYVSEFYAFFVSCVICQMKFLIAQDTFTPGFHFPSLGNSVSNHERKRNMQLKSNKGKLELTRFRWTLSLYMQKKRKQKKSKKVHWTMKEAH